MLLIKPELLRQIISMLPSEPGIGREPRTGFEAVATGAGRYQGIGRAAFGDPFTLTQPSDIGGLADRCRGFTPGARIIPGQRAQRWIIDAGGGGLHDAAVPMAASVRLEGVVKIGFLLSGKDWKRAHAAACAIAAMTTRAFGQNFCRRPRALVSLFNSFHVGRFRALRQAPIFRARH